MEIFDSVEQAGFVLENWRQEYNNFKPYSALAGLSPSHYVRHYQEKLKLETITT